MTRVEDFIKTEELEHELDAVAFEQLNVEEVADFSELPDSNWASSGFPTVTEEIVGKYLKRLGAYTKNYRTGVRLCHCGHIYNVQCSSKGTQQFVSCKCRPTMHQHPPFYQCFVVFDSQEIRSGNCRCPAGETQSCVHLSALLLTLIEVSQTSCTSLPRAWLRPRSMGTSIAATELNFGRVSIEGYVDEPSIRQTVLDVGDLLKVCDDAGVVTGASIFFAQEEDRIKLAAQTPPSLHQPTRSVLTDPLDKLTTTMKNHDITVDDLIMAMEVTSEETSLLQTMTSGQRHNPPWMDAREWRVTASNFGRVCNRAREAEQYPPSLIKLLLGDYGQPSSAALQWGINNEDVALHAYEQYTGSTVFPCGFYVCLDCPFLGASPDDIVFGKDGEMGIVEIKCPYVSRPRNPT